MKKKLFLLFLLLISAVKGTWAASTAQAVWVEGNKTLYFIYQEPVSVGDAFDGKTVTSVWSGEAVTNTGNDSPKWRNIMRDVEKVKFDNSFNSVKPKSFDSWFWGFEKVTSFDGLNNLDTSEATTMDAMFYACSAMKSINVSTFDMGKVETMKNMFWGCDNLKTITCDKTWNYDNAHSSNMFWSCKKLKGAREYSRETESDYNATMANPVMGYFTMTDGTVMSGEGTEDKPIELSKALDWDVVGNYVAAGKDCSSLYFQMIDKFTVTSTIGTESHPFNGTFDGNTKLLTANIDGGTKDATAPFAYIAGATIKGVTVDGTITGGIHSAGLVGCVKEGTNVVTDCYVVNGATITTTNNYAGGLIGHGRSSTLTVSGCVFEGTVTRAEGSVGYVGAIVGWCDSKTNITVSDCFELGTYTNFAHAGMNYVLSAGVGNAFGGEHCYSTKDWGETTRVYEIDGAEDLTVFTPVRQAYPTTLTFYGNNEKAGGLCFRQIDEIYEGMIWDIDYEYYAAASDVVKFIAQTSNVTVEDEDKTSVTVTGDNTELSPLQFTMPPKKVTISVDDSKYAYAIWCSGNSTLYFTYTTDDIKAGDTYSEQTVTSVWKGNDVLNVGWITPKWNSIASSVTSVVFDSWFADARPTSLFMWFCNMNNLENIEGLAYLNTSEVTNTNSMFYNCFKLVTLDVDHFDMSKVTNATAMFCNNTSLTTIYCSQSWDIATAVGMFIHCYNLTGAVKYNNNKTNCEMANPTNGYFTRADTKAYALFCIDNYTLYFTTSETPLTVGGSYQGHTITNLYNGDAVTHTGTGSESPGWIKSINRDNVKYVVFDESFAGIKPTNLAEWFRQMSNLESITGLQYLNTSEATMTHTMFAGTEKIETLDVSHFDMSKVTDATQMFAYCTALTTIYCNDTWTVSSDNMFQGSTNLKGAVDFDEEQITAAMANPYTGYFTATKNVYELACTEDWNQLADYVNAGNSCSKMTFTMTKDFKAGKMIGTDEHHFRGTFDGDGYMLEVEYGSEKSPVSQNHCAPFRYIGYGARIENLIVTGDIYTSAKGGAGVVSQTFNEATLSNILCTVNIHSSFDSSTTPPYDPAFHGGLIGNVNGDNDEDTEGTTIVGCSFQGSLLGEKSDGVGGFVGIKSSMPYLTIYDSFFAPKEVTMLGSHSNTFSRYANTEAGDGALTFGDICYYTTTLGTAQGQKAQVIKDESESCFINNISDYYNVSMIITHTDGTSTKTSMLAFVVDEIDDGDIDGEYQWLAASGGNIYFESAAIDLAAKDADGAEVTLPNDDGNNYHFTMPEKDVTITGGTSVPYAIWCEGNRTLYFDYSDQRISMGDTYDGQTVTRVWSSGDVVNIGWSTPKWSDHANTATTVVFTEAFATAKPTSMNRWFTNFRALTTINGIENLNTSEVIVMNSTFYDCDALTRIDVNSFDVSKVTNATSMFGNCDNLETIFCNNTWNITTTAKMFYYSRKLKSPNLSYSDDKINGAYANPNTGYFTSKNLSLTDATSNNDAIALFDGISGVNATLSGRTLYKDGDWNTLCLPFDVTIEGSPLDGATLMELDVDGTYDDKMTGFNEETGDLYLFFKEASSIKAGKPYIIKWEGGENITTLEFSKVTIKNAETGIASKDNKVAFIGNYDPITLRGGNKENLYLGTDNKLYTPTSDKTMNSFRAYFYVDLGISMGIKRFVLTFGKDGEVTEIVSTEQDTLNMEQYSDGWYTMQGIKLETEPTAPGIYINNGIKVVIK